MKWPQPRWTVVVMLPEEIELIQTLFAVQLSYMCMLVVILIESNEVLLEGLVMAHLVEKKKLWHLYPG